MINQSDVPITQSSERMEGKRKQKIGNYCKVDEEGPRVETDAKEQRSGDSETETDKITRSYREGNILC